MHEEPPPVRSLSQREAEVVGWLESERLATVTNDDVRTRLGWPSSTTYQVLARLAKKGWLRRTAQGRYETLLAETGGWAVPNPWAALATWGQRYYVGLQSGAYELQLTPDRPNSVQTCVAVGAKRPRAWADIPITVIHMPEFSVDGTELRNLHGFEVNLARVEKVLIDSAVTPDRVGGVGGLARTLDRAHARANWAEVVTLAEQRTRGRAALRRTAAVLEVLGHEVPGPLRHAATARPGDAPLYLGDRRTHGSQGGRLKTWQVIDNVFDFAIRDEVRH